MRVKVFEHRQDFTQKLSDSCFGKRTILFDFLLEIVSTDILLDEIKLLRLFKVIEQSWQLGMIANFSQSFCFSRK
jgi:hypothetical protein